MRYLSDPYGGCCYPHFSDGEMEAKRGKWFDNQSCKGLQVITVVQSPRCLTLPCDSSNSVLSVTLARETCQPAPKPPQIPLAHLAVGPGVPRVNSVLSLAPATQWQNVIPGQAVVLSSHRNDQLGRGDSGKASWRRVGSRQARSGKRVFQ